MDNITAAETTPTTDDHPRARRKGFRRLIIAVGACVALIGIITATVLVLSAHAQRKEEIIAEAQTDAALLARSATHMHEAFEHYLDARANTQIFLDDQLKPALEVATEHATDSDEELTFFDRDVAQLRSLVEQDMALLSLDADFDGKDLPLVLQERYLVVTDEERNELRADVAAEAQRRSYSEKKYVLEEEKLRGASDIATESFGLLLTAAAKTAHATLDANDSASKDTRNTLQQTIDQLENHAQLTTVFSAGSPADLSESWLQATDALSKYQDAGAQVRASHEIAIAPPPPPKPQPKPQPQAKPQQKQSGGSSKTSGRSSGGTCTWMVWGPLAPYWVWGPCSDMP